MIILIKIAETIDDVNMLNNIYIPQFNDGIPKPSIRYKTPDGEYTFISLIPSDVFFDKYGSIIDTETLRKIL